MVQRQHGGAFLRPTWDLSITVLHNSTTFRDELAAIGGDHSDFLLGFRDSLMAWGTSSAWQVGQ